MHASRGNTGRSSQTSRPGRTKYERIRLPGSVARTRIESVLHVSMFDLMWLGYDSHVREPKKGYEHASTQVHKYIHAVGIPQCDCTRASTLAFLRPHAVCVARSPSVYGTGLTRRDRAKNIEREREGARDRSRYCYI